MSSRAIDELLGNCVSLSVTSSSVVVEVDETAKEGVAGNEKRLKNAGYADCGNNSWSLSNAARR